MPLSPLDVAAHAALGLAWSENGQSVLSGALLDLYERLDRTFVGLSAGCGAERIRFPTFIPARELHKLDYFRSFPHLVTFPVALDQDDEQNLKTFTDGEPIDDAGCLHLTRTAPLKEVLTPAACYHVYVHMQGKDLAQPLYVTTVNTCFRREKRYAPLERQWAFSMREIVCVGSENEVTGFLDRYRKRVSELLAVIGLPIEWMHATDPFFNPRKNPRYIAQKLDPVKHEMVFRDSLAIGSVNFHRSYFGDAFAITRGGEVAYSGCVAFGIERWILEDLLTFGKDPARWPTPAAAAGTGGESA
jgi:seryl-tRNA synthetase